MIYLQSMDTESVFAGLQLFDKFGIKFFQRLGLDLLSVLILIRFIYFPLYRSRENVFTFFIFNIIIFLITYLLNKVEMSMGAAFGLFAVFSMLRYRTEDINTKDMTYMFLVIALGLLNAVSKGSWDDFALFNFIIILITYLLESNLLMKKEVSRMIMYENIELIKPDKKSELIADLENRMGVKINHVTIGRIDFLRDSVQLFVYYYE
ncbi:MAG: DUF4956 domain-containing protein [Bacteroidia bacterium]|nr:DUF4956 domain-containing protein [Bacteroidia bacterium]MCZ2277998.1 DUF4956 domain-containing protein [Bacteroidia bacterium]